MMAFLCQLMFHIILQIQVNMISLDFGPSIVLWVMDNDAQKNCNHYLVFNNIVKTKHVEERKKVCW